MKFRTDARFNRTLLSISLIVSLVFSLINWPAGKTAEADSAFHPPVIRGFNTSAFGDLKRVKDVFGANAVRLQLTPVTEAARSRVSIATAWERQLDKLEYALKEAARQGMYVIVDLHEPPLADPNMKQIKDAFWSDDGNLQVLIDCWKEIAQRFKPYRANIWGYDLLNEPTSPGKLPDGAEQWPDWAQQIVDAIRVYDPDTPIIYEPSPGADPLGFFENQKWQRHPAFRLLKDDKVIYSLHVYNPHAYTHQGLSAFNKTSSASDWPGKAAYPSGAFNKKWLLKQLQQVISFQKKYNVPIYVGEFSAIRWAPGAAEYIRDLIDIFEENGWSWSYHAYQEWHGWDVEYNDVMTSDANRESAKAAEPTDRELVLKAYFTQNKFLSPKSIPSEPVNLIKNGGFDGDDDKDGLADSWVKARQVTTSLVKAADSSVQKVTVPPNGGGLFQAFFPVSAKNRYLIRAKIRVDSGKVKLIRFDFANASSKAAGTEIMHMLTDTEGEFVTKTFEFVPSANVTQTAFYFWADYASEFMIDSAEMYDLGPVVPETPPPATAVTADGDRLLFKAAAQDGRTIAATEYRVVGRSAAWTRVPAGGVTFTPGKYIVAYRSIDSAGTVERANSVLFTSMKQLPLRGRR